MAEDLLGLGKAAETLALPVYVDTLQPSAKVLGKTLETVSKAVATLLAPVERYVVTYEAARKAAIEEIEKEVARIPTERLQEPPLIIAVPALQALQYTCGEPPLREMYAKLLATAMDEEVVKNAHPAFAEFIKQLSPDEAKMLKALANSPQKILVGVDSWPNMSILESVPKFIPLGQLAQCQFPELEQSYVDNLCRLGLTEVPSLKDLIGFLRPPRTTLVSFREHTEISLLEREVKVLEKKERHALRLTALGEQFCIACVL